MKCPIDQTDLQMTERQGIEIDYCPKCRGVWLDRGELDKIVERAGLPVSRGGWDDDRPLPPRPGERPYHHDDDDDDDYRHGRHEGEGRKRRRKSLLGELFDF